MHILSVYVTRKYPERKEQGQPYLTIVQMEKVGYIYIHSRPKNLAFCLNMFGDKFSARKIVSKFCSSMDLAPKDCKFATNILVHFENEYSVWLETKN